MSSSKQAFNPVKQDVDGVRAIRAIWSTKSIELALKGLNEGRKLFANPFYENNTKLLKGDLNFERTDEEIEEFKRCMNDVVYFGNRQCQLMTPEGIKHIKLRDYQENYLKHLEKNRLSIYLSCRQSSKCLDMTSYIECTIDWTKYSDDIQQYFNQYKTPGNTYYCPLFEIVNLYRTGWRWRIKYKIYSIITRLTKTDCKTTEMLYKIISLLDRPNESDEKIIWSHILQGICVKSKSGFVPAMYIHETKPLDSYRVTLKSGLIIDCADTHLFFRKGGKTVNASDLKTRSIIKTEYGLDTVVSVIKLHHRKISMADISVNEEDSSYYTNHILSHNTTSSAIFLLHYAIFNTDKNALVLGNKFKTACEILDKIKKIYLELPYFLKPGIYKWNASEIVFDNGCRIMAEATTINSGISFTYHCVLADEFAHVPPNILDKFYNNLFPVITAGKARFMITSTQNGNNLFARLYNAAVAGENEYKAFKTDWWEVPEWNPETKMWDVRDEVWHRLQIANYGGEEGFNKQFGTSFDISANTLIASRKLQDHAKICNAFVPKEMPDVIDSDHFFWDPTYDIENLKKDFFAITIDISEGIGGDSTVFIFNKIIDVDHTIAVGIYKSNEKTAPECAHILRMFCIKYLETNHYIISLEYNLYGELFVRCLKEEIESDEKNMTVFDESCIVKYWNDDMTKFTLGKRITSKTKSWGLASFKQKFEKDMIEDRSLQFSTELYNFTDIKGTGTYQASYGHDDIVMAQMQMVFVMESMAFKELCAFMIATNEAEKASNSNRNDDSVYMNPSAPRSGFFDMFAYSDEPAEKRRLF